MSIEEILRNGLHDGQFLDMQTRIFDISEVVMRAKSKPKPAPKPAPKPDKDKGDKRAEENPAPGPGGEAQRQSDEAEDFGGGTAAGGDGDDDEEMEIAISSEYPVKRWYGTEILDHSPESVDMSRARRGLAFLLEHNTRDVIGIVENCRIDPDKKLRGNPRFSKNPRPQEVKRDIKDGIRKDISVGYMAEEAVLEKQSDTEGNTYRITRWTPLEASSVAVPADPTVGHGRMVREGARMSAIKLKENPAPKPNTEVSIMATTEQETRTAAAEIFRLGKRHGIPDDQVLKMVEEGISIETASARILAEVEKKNARALPQPGAERVEEDFRLSESEQAEYNLARGIMALASNREYSEAGTNKRVNCFELEVSDVLEKQWSRAKHGGLFVPWSIKHARDENLERKYPRLYAMHKALRGAPGSGAGLDTTATGKGGALVFIEPGEFIQFLYNRMRIKELGARTLAGLRDNVAFPKQTGSVSGSWVGENTGSDVADSALTLSQIPSSPKTYQSSTSYSRQLLAQAVVDIDTLVREDLARNQALSLDLAAINGAVATPQLSPVGILNTTGVQTYDQPAAVNGWSPTWKDILVMSQKLEDVNADQLGTGGWLTTPGVKTNLKNTSRLANTIALPIWTDDDEVTGAPARSTNQVPKNGTMGTGTSLHTLIRGIFETIIVGMWGNGFELVVDPYRLKKQGMIELTTFMLADVVLTYPSAFVCTSHIIP